MNIYLRMSAHRPATVAEQRRVVFLGTQHLRAAVLHTQWLRRQWSRRVDAEFSAMFYGIDSAIRERMSAEKSVN